MLRPTPLPVSLLRLRLPLGQQEQVQEPIEVLLSTTQLANGAAYFALFNAPNLPTAIAAAALIGLPGSVLLISVETHIQRTAPPAMLGRIGALFFAVDSLAAVVGALGAPALVTTFGLTPALNTISALALVAVPVLASKKSRQAFSDRVPEGH